MILSSDTDRAPPIHSGNGGDSKYPCAVHEAALAECRLVITELRDLAKHVASRLDDEITDRRRRDNDIEHAILELVAVVGHPPDASTGTPGSGMRGQIAAAINATVRGGRRVDSLPPAALDAEESEITGVMDRRTLVVARRQAIADVALARQRVRLALIGLGVTLITTLGTVVSLWLTD